jgi:hypothetical protein
MEACLCIDLNTDIWYELAQGLSHLPTSQLVMDVAKYSYDQEQLQTEVLGVPFLQALDKS